MKLKIIFIVYLLITGTDGFCQTESEAKYDTIFKRFNLDGEFNVVSQNSSYEYYAIIPFMNDKTPCYTSKLKIYYKEPVNSVRHLCGFSKIYPAIVREGACKKYFKSGKLNGDYYCVNDKLEGDYIKYDENGTVRERGHYTNDKANGEYRVYYDNGKLEEVGTDKNGIRVGTFEKWDYYGNYLGRFNQVIKDSFNMPDETKQ